MPAKNTKESVSMTRLLPIVMVAVTLLFTATAQAAAPGITGPTFNLTARASYISQPDGSMMYSWGYGCNGAPAGFNPPVAKMPRANCPNMQVPGPTLIVTEGQTVTVNLTNNLPAAAGNTSILFPGFQVTASGGVPGLLTGTTGDAVPGTTVSYTFTASSPGTRAYYSGTQGDLQVEMGLYGALIVLPSTIPSNCTSGLAAQNNLLAEAAHGETDFRLAAAAYDHAESCYDREYLFQFSEIDPRIHRQAEEQVAAATRTCTPGNWSCYESSVRAAGSIPSTSMATTCASWRVTGI